MIYPNLKSLQKDLLSGNTTCISTVRNYLDKIELSNQLNIYVEVFEHRAVAQAQALDRKIESTPDKLGKLFGLVVSIKDVLCYEGHEVTAGSKILSGFRSSYSATAVQRLLDEDAIVIGRTNCDEFAMGSANENSHYGPTINGSGENRVPGGSSGGSAVSVQMDTCMVALGSDTGGSVRQPAGFCGVIGFKPTYGRISRYGLIAYGSSFDQIGLMAKDVADIAQVLECIAGADEFDSTASRLDVPTYKIDGSDNGPKKFAILDVALNHPSLQADVKQATELFINDLKSKGHSVDVINFDLLEYAVPAYYVLTTAEASSNLARFDGVRYGYRSENATDIHEVYTKSRTEGFGDEVKRRILMGAFVLSAGYYDAYYGKAQKVRRMLQEQTNTIFENYDHLILPVSPTTAWEVGAKNDDPIAVYLSDIFTVLANLTGHPGMSLPIGKDKNDLPIGIQIMSQSFSEDELLWTGANLLS